MGQDALRKQGARLAGSQGLLAVAAALIGSPASRHWCATFLLIVPAVIVAVTRAANLLARRAALIDPLAALRQE
jgi:hypothetical protein